MSEDVKPRIKVTDESFGLMGVKSEIVTYIELEPTIRLMEEMAKALDEIRFHEQKYVENSPEETTYYLRVTNKALEKYKKFKEALK